MRLHQFVFSSLLPALMLLAGCHQKVPTDPRLQAPHELVQASKDLDLKNLFVNPSAQGSLPELGAPKITVDPADAAATRDPSTWRRLDRAHRYDGVLLAGPVAEFTPLLTHLATSPDIRLARVDNWGVLFARNMGTPFVPPAVKLLEKSFPDPKTRTAYLAQMAMILDVAGLAPAAREYTAAAIKSSPNDARGFVAAAAIALRHKQISDALQNAERALKIDSQNEPALEIEVQALAAVGASDAAWLVAKRLKAVAPADDMNALFLHARVANAAHAYGDEQASLEALVQIAEKQRIPAADYRIYLGQCYARQGLARPALEQFEILSNTRGLTDQQRADVATAIQSIRKHVGELGQ